MRPLLKLARRVEGVLQNLHGFSKGKTPPGKIRFKP
jgi:hypothetical protein